MKISALDRFASCRRAQPPVCVVIVVRTLDEFASVEFIVGFPSIHERHGRA